MNQRLIRAYVQAISLSRQMMNALNGIQGGGEKLFWLDKKLVDKQAGITLVGEINAAVHKLHVCNLMG